MSKYFKSHLLLLFSNGAESSLRNQIALNSLLLGNTVIPSETLLNTMTLFIHFYPFYVAIDGNSYKYPQQLQSFYLN